MGIFDFGGSTGRSSSTTSGTRTTQKKLSQEAVDKLIYDVLSSTDGLAALVNMENASGGYGASTKGLMAQDFLTKVIGEIANITAPTVETTDSKTVNKETKGAGKVSTVICTYLMSAGYMPVMLYLRGVKPYLELNPIVLRGYRVWAEPVVSIMKTRPWLCRLLAPIAIKRYEYTVDRKFSFTGWASVWIAEPICYVIGLFVPSKMELTNG